MSHCKCEIKKYFNFFLLWVISLWKFIQKLFLELYTIKINKNNIVAIGGENIWKRSISLQSASFRIYLLLLIAATAKNYILLQLNVENLSVAHSSDFSDFVAAARQNGISLQSQPNTYFTLLEINRHLNV